jgi:hypothetical protein
LVNTGRDRQLGTDEGKMWKVGCCGYLGAARMFGGSFTALRVLYRAHVYLESGHWRHASTLFYDDVGGSVQRVLQDSVCGTISVISTILVTPNTKQHNSLKYRAKLEHVNWISHAKSWGLYYCLIERIYIRPNKLSTYPTTLRNKCTPDTVFAH